MVEVVEGEGGGSFCLTEAVSGIRLIYWAAVGRLVKPWTPTGAK